jgi:hypothetical protein
VGPDELVLLQPILHHVHCPCVSEPQWARLQWIATAGWVALAEVQLVPRPDRAALAAADFVYAPRCVPGPPDSPLAPRPPASREEALARFLADLI